MVRLLDNQQQNMNGGFTWSQQRPFEEAIVIFPENMLETERWQRVATHIPGKTSTEVKEHFHSSLHHLYQVEPGRFELPSYSYDSAAVMPEVNDSLSVKTNPVQRKKRLTWTEEEHRLFLIGMEKYGKGDWKSIASKVVKSKTATQIASHAQKYFKRQEFPKKERKRTSIHDITLENIDLVSSPNDLHVHNVPIQHVQEPQQAQDINQNWAFPPLDAYNVSMQQPQEKLQNWVCPPVVPMQQLHDMHQAQENMKNLAHVLDLPMQQAPQGNMHNWIHATNVPMQQLQEPQQAQAIMQNWIHAPVVPMQPLHAMLQAQGGPLYVPITEEIMPYQMGGFGFGDSTFG